MADTKPILVNATQAKTLSDIEQQVNGALTGMADNPIAKHYKDVGADIAKAKTAAIGMFDESTQTINPPNVQNFHDSIRAAKNFLDGILETLPQQQPSQPPAKQRGPGSIQPIRPAGPTNMPTAKEITDFQKQLMGVDEKVHLQFDNIIAKNPSVAATQPKTAAPTAAASQPTGDVAKIKQDAADIHAYLEKNTKFYAYNNSWRRKFKSDLTEVAGILEKKAVANNKIDPAAITDAYKKIDDLQGFVGTTLDAVTHDKRGADVINHVTDFQKTLTDLKKNLADHSGVAAPATTQPAASQKAEAPAEATNPFASLVKPGEHNVLHPNQEAAVAGLPTKKGGIQLA